MIQMENVTKTYDRKEVFSHLNLTFQDKGLYLLCGSNGSGKSTLLYMLSGLLMDYIGKIYIFDKLLKDMSEKERERMRKEKVSIVFSHGNLFSCLSTSENLNFQSKKKLTLPFEEHRNISDLSGGQEILLALLHEFSLDKEIYLLDEVTSELDENHVREVMDMIARQSEKSLVILAMHDKRVIQKYNSHIIDLDEREK